MLIYLIIFVSKILENALSTLRIIVVSNGKMKIGALLQGLVALVWILVTGVVIIDINKDIIKIFMFCLGSMVGSFLGSLLEEKIALGNSITIAVINKIYINKIKNHLIDYKINTINENDNTCIIMIFCKRNKNNYINNIIKQIDNKAIITNQKSKILN